MAVISVEAKTMHKARIFFLLLLYSATSVGQEPQWTVTKHVTLMQQDSDIFQTTLLTPGEPGFYRISIYLSGGDSVSAGSDGNWTMTLRR